MKLFRADTASNFSLRDSAQRRVRVFASFREAQDFADEFGYRGYIISPTNDPVD